MLSGQKHSQPIGAAGTNAFLERMAEAFGICDLQEALVMVAGHIHWATGIFFVIATLLVVFQLLTLQEAKPILFPFTRE